MGGGVSERDYLVEFRQCPAQNRLLPSSSRAMVTAAYRRLPVVEKLDDEHHCTSFVGHPRREGVKPKITPPSTDYQLSFSADKERQRSRQLRNY